MADWAMKVFRCGLAEDVWDHPEINIKHFQEVEAKLDELRSYLFANSSAVSGYVRAYCRGERVGTAHVESTVNELIDWRFCKKQQMSWTKVGAQALLHVKTAELNGTLHRYTRRVDPGAIAACPPAPLWSRYCTGVRKYPLLCRASRSVMLFANADS